MAFLDPNLPFLAVVQNPTTFTSPYPSTYDSPKLQALGGLNAASIAASGASAWTLAQQIAMKAKAVHVGDLRTDWLKQIVKEDPVTGAFSGFFAEVLFSPTTDPLALEKKLVNSGFDIAGGIVSAIPVYGQIIAAVLDVAQFFYNLFRQPDDKQTILVPWAQYSQGLDEDLCKHVVFPQMATVDWTRLFWPSLDWTGGFRLFETDEGSSTRAWGTFAKQGGDARYTTNAPGSEDGGGLGFQPGTQKMADVVQLAIGGQYMGPTGRIDIITEVGNFYPATAQTCTALWEMVMKSGSPDMFKIRAGQLKKAWDDYYDAMRQSFAAEWNWRWAKGYSGDHREEVINLGKVQQPALTNNRGPITMEGINSRWCWPGMTRKRGDWQPDPNDGRPYCVPSDKRSGEGWWDDGWGSDIHYQAGAHWPPDRCYYSNVPKAQRESQWDWLDNVAVEPACGDLKKAQHRALYRTIVCAYVRPDPVQGLPRYGAFDDTSAPIGTGFDTFGQELRERCKHAREVLLTRDLRFKVRLEDVDAIDPPFAARLRASGVKEDSWKHPVMRITSGADLGEAEPVPPSQGPQGGTPFQVHARPTGGGGAGLLLGGAAIAAFAALKGR